MQRLLDIENLRTTFDIHVGKVQAVRGVNLHVDEGETVGVVGESGCGKSVSMLSVLHLLPDYAKISADKMIFDGTDLTRLTPKMFRKISGDQIGMIFQDCGASLSPTRTIGEQIIESMAAHRKVDVAEAKRAALELFEKLHFQDGERIWDSYPFELSGGMNQRAGIAIAMLMNPAVLLADEPTSALDMAVQRQVVEEMLHVREAFGTAIIIVTHDIGVVSAMADSIVVLSNGRVMEYGTAKDVLENPQNDYTVKLLSAVPRLRREKA